MLKKVKRNVFFDFLQTSKFIKFFLTFVFTSSTLAQIPTPKKTSTAKAVKTKSSTVDSSEDILFEGYSKITSGKVPVGYVVTRYEFRSKETKFYCTYFLKTGQLGSDVSESLKAVADVDLKPISYSYTSIAGQDTKTIDAKFSGQRMTASVKTGKTNGTIKTVTVIKDLPKGTFLSSFLIYLMLKSKTGLQTDSKYQYEAIAEEDAALVKGEAIVANVEKYNGFQAFKVFNRFKDARFTSYVTDRGEVLAAQSPSTGIGTELVSKPSEAIGNFPMNAKILQSLFGDVPIGNINAVSKKAVLDDMPPPPAPKNPKQEGVPQGQGIQIKNEPTLPNSPESPKQGN